MRSLFAREITSLAKVNKNVVLLSGDIGNRMFDEFKDFAPNRYINCGIAEANIMSMADGMDLSGLRPRIYTINPFYKNWVWKAMNIESTKKFYRENLHFTS